MPLTNTMDNQFTPAPLEWVATLEDDSLMRQVLDDPALKYNGDLDFQKVKRFFIQIGEQIICGVDLENKVFIIGGVILHTNLPEGKYQLISFKRVQVTGGSISAILYCFGLQANIDGKNYKQVFSLNPNGSYTLLGEDS